MGEEMKKRQPGAITRCRASNLLKKGLPVWGVTRNILEDSFRPWQIATMEPKRRRTYFENYWFAHAYALRVNEKRLRDGHGRKR